MPKHKLVKIGVVMAGYILALIGACVALLIRMLMAPGTAAPASAGMSAFGDAILFLLVFGIIALMPTGLGFYFLRSHQNFWNGFGLICLAFSITGLAVVLANTLINANGGYGSNSLGLLLSLIGLVDILGAPLFVVCFVLLALMAPSVRSRLFLLISAGCELLAGLSVLVNLFLFQRFF